MAFGMKVLTLTFLLLPAICMGEASPISKVLQLLSDLQTKVIGEGEEATKTYKEFSEWCEERSKNLGFEIKTGKAEVQELQASIAEETSITASLTAKMEELAASTATNEADLKAATKLRSSEAGDFATEEKELLEIIDTLQRAIGILEREMQKGGASMMQLQRAGSVVEALGALVRASALTSADAEQLTALVQGGGGEAGLGAPEAAVYEGQSGGIVGTLEDLLEKSESQLSEARNKETAALHNFEMLKQSLEDEIKYAAKEMAEAKHGIAASGEKKATSEGDLQTTSAELKEDTIALADLHHNCMTKAQDYEAETKSRGEELKALATAKKAISDNTAGAGKLSYGFNQVAFLQVSRTGLASSADLANFEAVRFIRDLAHKHHSSALAQLAARMSAVTRSGMREGQDIFGKVKGLISDMIAKLEEEASKEATHKAYCDKELGEANEKKADKDAEVEKLSIKIEQMSARSAKLKEEVAAVQSSLSELAQAQAEMDRMRIEEKEDYTQNKEDLEKGLEGVKLALKVLRDYYGQAAGAAHSAAEGAGASIVGLLEVCESDLSKSLAETVATEQSAASTYESETKENEVEKTSKSQDLKYKAKEAADLDKAVAETSADRAGVQEELDAVLATLKALNKECTAKVETYAERKARRETEIAGLKEALSILEGPAALIQQQSRRTLRGGLTHGVLA
mmetsp:Transcript_152163/g.369553  ORF Transcript_152163/g.369553 Transcript_152163/m.369553 type:complete len:689 (+) Transcript_152163:81-2147(+)